MANKDDDSLFVYSAGAEEYEDLDITERAKVVSQNTENGEHDASTLSNFPSPKDNDHDIYSYFRSNPITLSTVLPYQKRIIIEMMKNDGLLILGRGLGYLKIAANLIHALDVAGAGISPSLNTSSSFSDSNSKSSESLVIVLGLLDDELSSVFEELRELSVIDSTNSNSYKYKPRGRRLKIINTENATTIDKRELLYSSGGMYMVTPRIFVVDLLSHVVDPKKISGIVVMHAEQVTASSTISFILRLFRQSNKTGFIKALSEEPEKFTGFSPLATMMKNLRVNKTFLWPRFHVSITDSLELQHLMYRNKLTGQWTKPRVVDTKSVIEIEVSLTSAMNEIQRSLMECIEACVSEIRHMNSSLIDLDSWNLDNALSTDFDIIIRRQLNPIWHRISPKTKRITNDLTVLRQLLANLLHFDAITFYKTLETIWISNSAGSESNKGVQSPWLDMDASEILFSIAKSRVFGTKSSNETPTEENENIYERVEQLPKWDQLSKILSEVWTERSINSNLNNNSEDEGPILIVCSTRSTARQISLYLRKAKEVRVSGKLFYSGSNYSKMLLRDYYEWKRGFLKVKKELVQQPQNNTLARNTNKEDGSSHARYTSKRRRIRGGSQMTSKSFEPSSTSESNINVADNDEQELSVLEAGNEVENSEEEENNDEMMITYIGDAYTPIDNRNLVVIKTFSNLKSNDYLNELKPSVIIMYEPDTTFVRQIEVYRSSLPFFQVKVYFMYYGLSVEEQRYLKSVRNEKESFTKLIREKANLPIVITNDLDKETPENAFLRLSAASNHITRNAGNQILPENRSLVPPRVIVDHREFRSSLPSLIHSQGMTVAPVTLIVADYILSPRICVERKSIPDLISSFRDGRLYVQCEAMFRYYERVVLLIEFDETKSFSLEPFSDKPGLNIKSKSSSNNVSLAYSSETASLIQDRIQSKLVLLLLQFPRLKVVWSMSPHHSAEIFYDMKLADNQEPDPSRSAAIGLDSDMLVSESDKRYNHSAISILKSIPGINSKNYNKIINKVKSLQDLCKIPETDLAELIGVENAHKAFQFLNHDLRKKR